MKEIRMVSLFSGIGAPEKALDNLNCNYKLINYCEIDKFASTSYSAIHNTDKNKNLFDVRKVNGNEFGEVDLLFHGSPCQSFSLVGKHEGGDRDSGTKSSLMWETVRIVKECLPKVVIWENVKSILNKRHKHNFELYLEELEELGYTSTYKIISPRDIGEAQSRARVFVVSTLDGKFVFPEINKEYQKVLGDYLEDNIPPKYILPKYVVKTLGFNNTNFTGQMIISNYNDLAGCLVAKSGRAARTNNFLLYNNDDYKRMSNNKDIEFLFENDIPIRSLTPLEYWRLQNFDDEDFYKAQKAIADTFKKGDKEKADSQLYKQAGNSINVKVLESFMGEVVNYIKNH
ncbi:Type II 5-methyl-cytosine DNA methyltransferase [Staphylococcus phage PT94]